MSSDADAPVKGRAGGAPSPKPSASAPDLKQLGKYQIEKKLGAGGMGTVYLARDTELRRVVALKVLSKDKAENPILVKRFKAEAQAAAQLRHDNIVSVYDTGQDAGYLFIAMEYVEGTDLHDLVARRGPIPVKRSIEIIQQVASALQHAYEHKIVHRDIKPSNLLLRRDGQVKLTDMGLARSVDDTIETGITRAGTTVGTVDYMSPEQARNSKLADIRSDLYSLGCTWYHMLTGGPPFAEGSLTNKLQAHAIKPPPDPRLVNDQVADGLVAVLHRLMAKKPEDRYQTPRELLEDIRQSTLVKGVVSHEIFEDDEPVETVSEGSGNVGAKSRTESKPNRSNVVMPPKRRTLDALDEPSETGPNLEWVKYALVIGLGIVAIAGLGWIISNLGSALGDPTQTQVNNVGEPFSGDGANTTVGEQVDGGPIPASGSPGAGTGAATTAGSGGAINPGGAPGSETTIRPGAGIGVGATTLPGVSTKPGTGAGPRTVGDGNAGGTPRIEENPETLPTWATAGQLPKSLAQFSVGGNQDAATRVSTLEQALEQVTPAGAVITLVGRGPYVIGAPCAVNCAHLTLAGDPNARTLVVLKPGAGALSLRGGTLELRNVHVTVDRAADPAGEPLRLFTVQDGSLFVRQSSLTVLGTSGPECVAFTVLPNLAAPLDCRFLLERTVIRGASVAAVQFKTPTIDAAIHESLLISGTAPVVTLDAGSSPSTGTANRKQARIVRVLRSTLCSSQRVFDLTDDADLPTPPVTRFSLVESVCCTGAGEGPQVLLKADGWGQEPLRESARWSSRDSVYLGFGQLIDFGTTQSLKVVDDADWQQFWKEGKAKQQQFSTVDWPTGLGSLATVAPGNFDRDFVPPDVRTVMTSSGNFPGIAADWLSVIDDSAAKLAALGRRRLLPPNAANSARDYMPRKVDLKKDDLGILLSRNDWPDGAVFEAFGGGVCTMSPVKLTKRQVRIVFIQSANPAPLKLTAREAPGKEVAGLFELDHCSFELDGLRWQSPDPKAGVKQPSWLVSAINSDVILRRCELFGAEKPAPPYQGLIHFESTSANRDDPPVLAALQSFLYGPGPLLRVKADHGSVFVHDSLLVTRGAAIELLPKAAGEDLPLTVDLWQSTFAATKAVVSVEAAPLNAPARMPVLCFADRLVIADPSLPIPGSTTVKGSVLQINGPVLAQHQFEWWGEANGVAQSVTPWVVGAKDESGNDQLVDKASWLKHWGDDHETSLLSDLDGVLMEKRGKNLKDAAQPEFYRLQPECKATRWAGGQRPLGANLALLDQIGPAPIAPPPTVKSTKSPPPSNPPKGKTVPTGTGKVGF